MDFNLIKSFTSDLNIDLPASISSNNDNVDDDEELYAELLALTSNDNNNTLEKKESAIFELKHIYVSDIPNQNLPAFSPRSSSNIG